jgi:hypothetical protein
LWNPETPRLLLASTRHIVLQPILPRSRSCDPGVRQSRVSRGTVTSTMSDPARRYSRISLRVSDLGSHGDGHYHNRGRRRSNGIARTADRPPPPAAESISIAAPWALETSREPIMISVPCHRPSKSKPLP